MRFQIIIALVACIVLSHTTRLSAQLANGLLGYWQFNNNGNDSSGFGRDLDLVGGVGFASGLSGQALDLHKNGSQYAVRPVDDNVFDFGPSNFTIQVWANFYNTNNFNQVLMEKFVGAAGAGWSLEEDGTQQWLFHTDATFRDLLSNSQSIPADAWHHIIVRRMGS